MLHNLLVYTNIINNQYTSMAPMTSDQSIKRNKIGNPAGMIEDQTTDSTLEKDSTEVENPIISSQEINSNRGDAFVTDTPKHE